MKTLPELQHQMNELVTWRNKRVAEAEQTIADVNRTFDRSALSLRRQINQLQEQQPREPAKRKVQRGELHLDGLTEDEVEHYKQLTRKGK